MEHIYRGEVIVERGPIKIMAVESVCDIKVLPNTTYALTAPGSDLEKVICFQAGSMIENGVNGLLNEDILTMLIHRTKKLNEIVPCRFNVQAVLLMEEALRAFEDRVKDRAERMVTGTKEE